MPLAKVTLLPACPALLYALVVLLPAGGAAPVVSSDPQALVRQQTQIFFFGPHNFLSLHCVVLLLYHSTPVEKIIN
jgi:hypothetical protein